VKEIQTALGEELLRVHVDSYGVGAADVTVLMNEDDVVVFLDGLELAPNERFLVDAGESDAVVEMRTRYQRAIEPRFRAIVEHVTGRRVESFLSTTDVGHRYAVEVFRLAPRVNG
jgi:uncharacterized protein YbcI